MLFARWQHRLWFSSGFHYVPLKAMVTRISKWSRIHDSFRITPKIESLVVVAIPDIPRKFQKNPSITFYLADTQTKFDKNITSLAEVKIKKMLAHAVSIIVKHSQLLITVCCLTAYSYARVLHSSCFRLYSRTCTDNWNSQKQFWFFRCKFNLKSTRTLAVNIYSVLFPADSDKCVLSASRVCCILQVPSCLECGGILKPDVVFFGDNVVRELVNYINSLVTDSDTVLVLGSSLFVSRALAITWRTKTNVI